MTRRDTKKNKNRAKSRRQVRRFQQLESLENRLLMANDLAALSDEFDDASSISEWQRVHEVENWNADQLQQYDIDQSQSGRLTMVPETVSWYQAYRGPMTFKEVSGDFVFTSQVHITDRDDVGGSDADDIPSDGDYSLGGVMIRTPRNITDPAIDWTSGSRMDDGTNNGENYVFLSAGHGADGSQFSLEVKTTRNSDSQLELTGIGAASNVVTLQIARIGSDVFALYQIPGSEWQVHRRYSRPDMPETLQLGLVTYSDWEKVNDYDPFYHNSNALTPDGLNPTPEQPFNHDLNAGFEYARFVRPDVPAELAAINLRTQATDQQLLSFLGAEANLTAEESNSDTGTNTGNNSAPALEPIANQSISLGGVGTAVDFVATDADGDTLSFEVSVVGGLANQVMQQHDLHAMSWRDDYALNWGGQSEKWLQGNDGWYFLLPDGSLNVWNGSFAASSEIAQFSVNVYDNPQLLLDGAASNLGAVIVGNQIVITPAATEGTHTVQLSASDGIATTTLSFDVTVTAASFEFDIPNQAATTGVPLEIDLTTHVTGDAQYQFTIDSITDKLSELNAEHGFWSQGNYYDNYLGQNERWIRNSDNQWHYLLPNGDLHRWNGSFESSPLIATLGTEVYEDPSRLTDPQAPTVTATVNANGVLTIVATNGYTGELRIHLSASDGSETATSTLSVTVNDLEALNSVFAELGA